ncbi:MAG TPA: nucleotidyltransferase domain-containing protein [Armatimonadota bacterium]|jgi:hypothetical protein
MIDLLETHRAALEELCRRYGVARLEVFGSAAEGDFDPQRSDVDFIVEFAPGTELGAWLERYFALREDLAALIGRPVDLVMSHARSFENPYFAREAARTRRVLYAA